MRGSSDRPTGPVRRAIVGLIAAPWLIALVWPMALIVLGAIAWQRYGAERVAAEFVRIDPGAVTITSAPEVFKTDITAAVFRDTAVDSISLLDASATAKIASAYSMHPWIRDVTSVRKLPGGGVDVSVAIPPRGRDGQSLQTPRASRFSRRGPLGRTGGDRPAGVPHYFIVDEQGVLLPSEDFSASQTDQYIHIDIPGVYSFAAAGTPFGERRVESAATLAAILHPIRERVGVRSIRVYGDDRRTITPQFEIVLDDQSTLFWGSPPGLEPEGEAGAAAKLRMMTSPTRGRQDDLRWAGRAQDSRSY